MNFVLVGAGGHAKAIVEAIQRNGDQVAGYADPKTADWLAARQVTDETLDEELPDAALALGIGGGDVDALVRRLELFDRLTAGGRTAPALVHPDARVSSQATLAAGAIVLAGAVVQPAVKLERAVIVNTGAIVEHDSLVGAGSHVAPGAIVLGGCTLGQCCMIGAGGVVLPGAEVKPRTLVPAATRHPK